MTAPVPISRGWIVASVAVLGVAVLAVLPPVVGGEAGGLIRALFSGVCHQLPDRSPHVAGGPIALCHRCSGILAGLCVGVLTVPLAGPSRVRWMVGGPMVLWLLVALLPTLIDWALGAFGVWPNTAVSRLLTGGLFGCVAGALLGANLLHPRLSAATSGGPAHVR